jgi:hypothetical protein
MPKKKDPEQMQLAIRSVAAPKKMRLGNASVPDVRKFYEALNKETATSWTDSNGVVRKLNRRGTAAETFRASDEILSQPTAKEKAKLTRQRNEAKRLAIKTNSTKRASGETKAQKALRGQGELFASSDIAETDEQIQKRIQKGIDRKRGGRGGGKINSVIGLGIGGSGLGAGMDELYGLQMAESSGRGGGGGRLISRPRKAL